MRHVLTHFDYVFVHGAGKHEGAEEKSHPYSDRWLPNLAMVPKSRSFLWTVEPVLPTLRTGKKSGGCTESTEPMDAFKVARPQGRLHILNFPDYQTICLARRLPRIKATVSHQNFRKSCSVPMLLRMWRITPCRSRSVVLHPSQPTTNNRAIPGLDRRRHCPEGGFHAKKKKKNQSEKERSPRRGPASAAPPTRGEGDEALGKKKGSSSFVGSRKAAAGRVHALTERN